MKYGRNLIQHIGWILYMSIAVMCLTASSTLAQDQDTAVALEKPTFIITPRLNSAGHFPFSGALLNNHANVDINVFFEYHRYGFFIFKSHDLEDPHSYVNYLQPGVFKKFKFSPRFALGAFAGYIFSQTSGFADKDSDFYGALVAYWTICEGLKLENTSLFFDLTQAEKLVNRFLLSYILEGFKVDFYVWHRMVLETEFHSTSASLALTFPGIKISEGFSVLSTVSYQGYLTDQKPDFAMLNGWLVTVAFPVTISK